MNERANGPDDDRGLEPMVDESHPISVDEDPVDEDPVDEDPVDEDPGADESFDEPAAGDESAAVNDSGGAVTSDTIVPAASPLERIWRRIIRRPAAWANRPWPTERVIKYCFTVFSLTATTAIMTNVVHLSVFPSRDLIFDNTTPTGGDFGAHVWGPAYMRDHLLPSFRLNGWTMDWYAGMPAYRFYMVLPALAILAADVFLKYGVAMKLVSVLGILTIPAACWAFGRLGKFRYPVPELMAFGGLAFVLDESFSIYGGNLKSTMAGEFSFSIALSIAILALGVLSAGLRTGKYRVWSAVLIAAAAVSHGIVLIFVAGAALIFSLVWVDRERLKYSLTVGVTSVLLIMWWAGPFLLNHAYMTDMKYGARPDGLEDSFWDMFFPLAAPLDVLITSLAIVGFLMSIVRRHLNGAALGVTGLVFVAGVYLARDSLPVIGLLWNPRLLPFVYLIRYLLMAVGAVEVLSLIWNTLKDRPAQRLPSVKEGTAFASITAVVVLLVLGWVFQELPGAKNEVKHEGQAAVYTWGPFSATSTNADAQGDGWARYNFQGYEGRGASYTEYHKVVTTMEDIGNDPALGCGRALWENHPDNGQYGTTMALMLLPHWTDGCIGSMEGLFFEASGTTPYHFLTTAAMSKQSSNPVRELRYTDNDATVGVPHLQNLGVRYVMVRSDEARVEAQNHPDLTLVGSSAPWDIYLVADSDIVVPLATQPVVVNRRPGDARERFLELGTSWFQHTDEWAAMPADDGPDDWQRIDAIVDPTRHLGPTDPGGPAVEIVVPGQPIDPVPLPPVSISNVEIEQQSLSFDVDQVGVPVLVRVSYFPNWNATGAEGPYRIGPNMMVVIPTDQHVEMGYGRTSIDYLTILLTLFGIGLCFWWRKRGDMEFESEMPGSLGQSMASVSADRPSGAVIERDLDDRPDRAGPGHHVDDDLTTDEGRGDRRALAVDDSWREGILDRLSPDDPPSPEPESARGDDEFR